MSHVYEVEKIVNHRYEEYVPIFKVRWAGYSARSDTWESAEELTINAKEAVMDYLDSVGAVERWHIEYVYNFSSSPAVRNWPCHPAPRDLSQWKVIGVVGVGNTGHYLLNIQNIQTNQQVVVNEPELASLDSWALFSFMVDNPTFQLEGSRF